jgi:hypothetical protein
MAPVLWLPLLARAPLQPPDALQELAFVELQVSVVAAPLLTVVGDALIAAVGGEIIGDVADPWPQATNSSADAIVMTGVKYRIPAPVLS